MNKCAHRDIKLVNYLILNKEDRFLVKFADFGISELYENCVGEYFIAGTLKYLP